MGVRHVYHRTVRRMAAMRPGIEALGMRVLATDAVMRDAPDRARLAREVLGFGAGLVAR